LQDEKDRAFNKALKYISSSLKTIKQIKDYLYKKEYAEPTVNYVIEKLIEYKYLDDEAYAKAFVLTYGNKYGKLKLQSLLYAKGVSQKIIDSIIDDIEIESSIDSVADKYMRNKVFDEKTRNKLVRFLMSRGYEYDDIKSVIEKYKG
jgi:regulatory protein